jgi:hypothetical protein
LYAIRRTGKRGQSAGSRSLSDLRVGAPDPARPVSGRRIRSDRT